MLWNPHNILFLQISGTENDENLIFIYAKEKTNNVYSNKFQYRDMLLSSSAEKSIFVTISCYMYD